VVGEAFAAWKVAAGLVGPVGPGEAICFARMMLLAARELPRRLARREDDWESALEVVLVEVLVRRGPCWGISLG
jgi:hypothetical protein